MITITVLIINTIVLSGLPADAFNRWEAGQVLAKRLMVHLYEAATSKTAEVREHPVGWRQGAAGMV